MAATKDDNKQPLLQAPTSQEANEPARSSNAERPAASADHLENIVWRGTTWQGCPSACFCCSPVCCSSWHWHITEQRIDLTHGCFGSNMETLDLRRIIDLHFQRNVWQLCCNRGTVIIHSDNDEFPRLHLTTFGAKEIFASLKQAWTKARIATAVHHPDDDYHHHH